MTSTAGARARAANQVVTYAVSRAPVPSAHVHPLAPSADIVRRLPSAGDAPNPAPELAPGLARLQFTERLLAQRNEPGRLPADS